MEKMRQWSSFLFPLKTEITQLEVKAGVKMKKTAKVQIKEFLV